MKFFLAIVFAATVVVPIFGLPTKAVSQQKPKLEVSPHELVNINGTLYYISPGDLIYTAVEALTICNDVNMRLLSLETQEKAQPIYNYLNENEHDRTFWLSGISYALDSFDHVFIWSGNGQRFTYTNWQTGQPNESSSKVDVCVYMDTERRWLDVDCSSVIAVICEY